MNRLLFVGICLIAMGVFIFLKGETMPKKQTKTEIVDTYQTSEQS